MIKFTRKVSLRLSLLQHQHDYVFNSTNIYKTRDQCTNSRIPCSSCSIDLLVANSPFLFRFHDTSAAVKSVIIANSLYNINCYFLKYNHDKWRSTLPKEQEEFVPQQKLAFHWFWSQTPSHKDLDRRHSVEPSACVQEG